MPVGSAINPSPRLLQQHSASPSSTAQAPPPPGPGPRASPRSASPSTSSPPPHLRLYRDKTAVRALLSARDPAAAPFTWTAVHLRSFCPTQLEILAWRLWSAPRGAKWHSQQDSKAKRLADGRHDAVEEIVFVLGTVDADSMREGFAMEFLGLGDEHLDGVVAKVVTDHKVKKNKKA